MKPQRFSQKKFDQFVSDNFTVKIETSSLGEGSMKCLYSKIDKGYIPEDTLKELFKMGITEQIQKKQKDGNVCCIGFNPTTKAWYGWSHRSICGFKIGEREREIYPDETKLGKACKTLNDCKKAAMAFAESVG